MSVTDRPATIPAKPAEVSGRTLAITAGVMAGAMIVILLACSMISQAGFRWPWADGMVWQGRMLRILAVPEEMLHVVRREQVGH